MHVVFRPNTCIMKNIFFLFVTLIFFNFLGFSQGTIRGKVTDENGETVFGVKIFNKTNRAQGAISDLDGNYNLKVVQSTPITLVVLYMGYDTIQETLTLKNNEILVKNFTLQPSIKTVTEVVTVAKQNRARDYYMENLKKNSATTIDYISSETMKKTGDANVTAAVARVSGVSTNGGLITVRGIGDRYVKTTLNGSRIPTLDPLTNNIKMDIFPSSLIDNVIITKTTSPELPGDWSGAYLSVETKDYPEKLEVNVESQFGYNIQTTFKDYISTDRSKTDWLGFDNGLRLREDGPITSPSLTVSTYQEFSALGLGSYFAGIGVNNWIDDGSKQSDMYFRLGLTELGILPKALINDDAAYNEAKKVYNQTYKPLALNKINPDGTNYTNNFANNWNTKFRKAPLNFSQTFSIGDQKTLFGKPFGYLFGFRYGNAVRFDPNGVSQRVGAEELNYQLETMDYAEISRETNSWSSLLNLAFKFNERNKISILFMPNFSGTNDVANYQSRPEFDPEIRVRKNVFYEQRNQLIYQLASQHLLFKSNMKMDYNFSYTDGNSLAPDFKTTEYRYVVNNGVNQGYEFSPNSGQGINRFYRYLKEDVLDTRLSFELPLADSSSLLRKLKFGMAYQRNDRKSDNSEYKLVLGNNAALESLPNEDLDSYLNDQRFIIKNGTIDYYYTKTQMALNHSFGYSNIAASYLMLDYEFSKLFRFAGGLRVEKTDIFTDVDIYHELGYQKNDLRRENVGGFPLINPAGINEYNYLPSGSIIYKLSSEKIGQTNFRFNYSQSVARPSMRELNDAAILDNEYRTLIYGNSDLKTAQIANYDFRGESYFKNGDNVSVSLFYKDFKNHIEMGFGSAGITWDNIETSSVKGVEFEGRKGIGKSFEIRANVTLVKSISAFIRKDLVIVEGVKVYTPLDTINRPMFGQAPYIINAIASYKQDSIGLTATLSYNIQGPRLVIAGVVKGRPDVYELPRHTLDFKISKKLGSKFSTSLLVRDILNAPVIRAYKLPSGWTDFDNFRYGANFLVSFAYKL
jgi:hypothetical protein